MSGIRPPNLQFGFYKHDKPDSETYNLLVRHLIKLGAKPYGKAMVCPADKYNGKQYRSLYDLDFRAIPVNSVELVQDLISDENQQLVILEMSGATGTSRKDMEYVQLAGVGYPAAAAGPHPVEIVASGDRLTDFLNGVHGASRTTACNLGLLAYKRFVSIVDAIDPSYATITIEETIANPIELGGVGNFMLFMDFYLSREFLGQKALDRVERLYRGAYVEHLECGTYISVWMFNTIKLLGRGPDYEEAAVEVARLIAAAGGAADRSLKKPSSAM